MLNNGLLCSVIVPIYNSESFLSDCLKSLKKQLSKSVEFLLIDDGSTDESLAICNKYADEDARFKVIHKGNGGVSSARNIGLKNAIGKYITFVDSDDYIMNDYFDVLVPLMEQDYELIVFNNYHELGVGKVKTYNRGLEEREYTIEELKEVSKLSQYYDHFLTIIGGVPWNKVFRNDLIKKYQLTFNEEMIFAEDASFTFDYLVRIRSFYLCNLPIYYYRTSNNISAIRNIDCDKLKRQMFDTVHILNKRSDYVAEIKLNYNFNNANIDAVFFIINRLVKSGARDREIKKIVNNSRAINILKNANVKGYYKLFKFLLVIGLYRTARVISAIKNRLFKGKNKKLSNEVVINVESINNK